MQNTTTTTWYQHYISGIGRWKSQIGHPLLILMNHPLLQHLKCIAKIMAVEQNKKKNQLLPLDFLSWVFSLPGSARAALLAQLSPSLLLPPALSAGLCSLPDPPGPTRIWARVTLPHLRHGSRLLSVRDDSAHAHISAAIAFRKWFLHNNADAE